MDNHKATLPALSVGPIVTGFAGLENSNRPLVFTSSQGWRASEYFDISCEK